MAITVALNHRTTYDYDRLVSLSPQIIRLRPAPHCRTPIKSYSLKIEPAEHFLNWQQDPQANYMARAVFPERTRRFSVEVDLVAELTVINPFDFFLEPKAEKIPFQYESWLEFELRPFLETRELGPLFEQFLKSIDLSPRGTADFLVGINQRLEQMLKYLIRLEPGVQSCEETLAAGSGSCRDYAWLLVQTLRRLGLAARFVSGYLIQLKPDVKALDGPSGTDVDFTDLHAWTEVYLPGAGWVEFDPTNGIVGTRDLIRVGVAREPRQAIPISGTFVGTKADYLGMSVDVAVNRVTSPQDGMG